MTPARTVRIIRSSYTKDTFPLFNKKKNENSSNEEGSKRIKANKIKIQLKFDSSKNSKNNNAFTFHPKQIKQLTDNVETILEVMETIKVNILSHNEYSDKVKKPVAEQQYLKAACVGDAVTQFCEAKRLARLEVFEFYTDKEEDSDSDDSTGLPDRAKISKAEASKIVANNIKWFKWVSKKNYCTD